MSFQCLIVTPEVQLLDATVVQVIFPGHDGLRGILTNRAPILARLGQGPLRIDLPGGQSQRYQISGGVAQMKDNVLTLLTQKATPIEGSAP